jgi:perosamine synthetase
MSQTVDRSSQQTPAQTPTAPLIPITKPYLGEEEAQAAAEAIRTGWIAQGPLVARFEEAIASRLGVAHVVATSNCTTSLHLALLCSGIGPDDEVICPSFSFIATANAVLYTGACPIFVDIDPQTYNIDPAAIEAAITPRTKAIIPVDQIGLAADLDAVLEIAERYRLRVIEDAAPALGAMYRGRPVGAISPVTCFSFHPRKSITTGEGGAIATNDTELAARARELAGRYNAQLAEIPGVTPPYAPDDAPHTYQSYCVRLDPATTPPRETIMERMLADGVATRRGVMAIHEEPYYVERFGHVSLPVTEAATRETLLLPLYMTMTDAEQDRVIDALRASVR